MFSIIIGRSAPQTSLKNALGGDCLRSAINNIFTLQSTYSKIWQSSIQKANNNCNIGDYSAHEERFECLQLGCDLDQNCDCAWCQCCSECSKKCTCDFAVTEPNQVMAKILGLGDDKYRYLQF